MNKNGQNRQKNQKNDKDGTTMTYWKWKTEISDGDDYESDESLQRCLADLEKAWATTYNQVCRTMGLHYEEWEAYETDEYGVVI